MTLRIEWRHLRGEADVHIEYVTRATAAECLAYWSERVATFQRVLFIPPPKTPFTCVCSWV